MGCKKKRSGIAEAAATTLALQKQLQRAAGHVQLAEQPQPQQAATAAATVSGSNGNCSSSGDQPAEQDYQSLLDLWTHDISMATTRTMWTQTQPALKYLSFEPAEHYVLLPSADQMVALAIALLAHPHWGPHLREQRNFEKVEDQLRAALACGHLRLQLADVCTTGLALALLPLCSVSVRCDVDEGNEEAMAAFYAALEHPTCTVQNLEIRGAAFGTRAAAAHLGRCVNVNSAIHELDVQVVGFCAKGVWAAFSDALTSNLTIRKLVLSFLATGNSNHVSATLADSCKLSALREVTIRWPSKQYQPTLKDMEGWGNMLIQHSTITILHLSGFPFAQGGGGGGLLGPVCDALLINTTLEKLTIESGPEEGASMDGDVECGVRSDPEKGASMDGDVDPHKLAEMLSTNRSLKCLNIGMSGIVCGALCVYQGLSHNSTLEDLAISVDAAGAEALMTALATNDGPSSNLKSLWLGGHKPESLRLGGHEPREPHTCGFPTALALGNMLATNHTLTKLALPKAPYTNEEWATTILPALANNKSLEQLDLEGCAGVDSGLVYDALLDLLDSNSCITGIDLFGTPLHIEGKSEVVDAVVLANKEYGAVLKDVPTAVTTSCRLVLCGYPYGGKSTILQTMICRHSLPFPPSSVTTPQRTRGIDIEELNMNDLTIWVWDFAGQSEFHPLQDFIFPNATSVHAATAFIFTFNPILTTRGQLSLKKKNRFKQEFSYWLRFIRSNSKQRSILQCKPLVLVVVTHKDKLDMLLSSTHKANFHMVVEEWVRDMALEFKDMISIDEDSVFFVDATDKNDSHFAHFEHHVIQILRDRIREVRHLPIVCDDIARALGGCGGKQLEPIISFADFTKLCQSVVEASTEKGNKSEQEALKTLMSGTKDKAARVIAAHLRDAGEVLYFSDLDFLVRNPRWFAHGILGHLIDIFPQDDEPATHSHLEGPSQSASQVDSMFESGLVSRRFLAKLLQRAVLIVGLNPAGTNADQLIQLMEKLDLCCKTGEKYLIPALLPDKDGKAERGECKREWTLHSPFSTANAQCIFVSRRLQCSDPLRTFITPGFFPRLQVVLKNLADQWGFEVGNYNHTCSLEKGFCRLILNDMEILVEYSGYFDYFVDIMAKSYKSWEDTKLFLETNIISEIRRLCASPKGCQGVTMVQAIIRPDCVGDDIALCRFRQSVQVATLEQQIVTAPDLSYLWPAVQDEHGNSVLPATFYKPQHLLDPDWIGWKQVTCYPDSNVNAGRRRGMAVIVSMVTYTERGDRSGGHEDEAKLKRLVGELEFEVELLQDFKAGELQRQLKELAATSIRAQDESFLCFVMGHGGSTIDGEQFIWDPDEDMIMLDDIVKPFRTCQHLQGKPKVFFVVSCRGSNRPWVHPQPEVHVKQPSQLNFNEGTEVRYLQEFTDCLMVFSTAVGTASTRYRGYGTSFVGALVTSLNHDMRQTTDVLGILNHVNEEVASEEHKGKDKIVFGQCPVVVHTLTKPLYWKSTAA